MMTLYSYPELFGVADNNGYGLKVFAFLRLNGMPFKHEHVFDASSAPRGQLPFIVDDGELVFTTHRDTPKYRALQRDPRVTICVDDPHPPYSFVQVQGVAAVTDDADDLLDNTTRTGARYMGADRADEFGRRNAVPGELVVRVRPTKVMAGFDISD